MTRGLAEAQQRLENLHPGFLKSQLVDTAKERCAIVIAKFVVKLSLGAFQLASADLVRFLRQWPSDLFVRPPKYERAERLGDELERFCSHTGAGVRAEDGSGAEKPGIQKFKNTPEIAQMVFDGRPGQRQTVRCGHQHRRLCGCRLRVLDGLRLVKNDGVEDDVFQCRRVTPQGAVS